MDVDIETSCACSEYYLAPDWRYRVEKEWYVRDLATSRYAAEWEGKDLGS